MSDDADTEPLGKAARRRAAGGPADLSLPTILIDPGQLPRAVDETLSALRDDPGLFQRGGVIVRPCIEAVPAAGGGATTSLRIVPITTPHIRESATRVANYMKFDARVGDRVRCNCPSEVAEAVCARPNPGLKPIAGVITAPLMRLDGSLLDEPGYDAATALLFEPCGATFPSVSRNATREDATAALKFLKAPLRSFPFIGLPDLAVALSGVITAVNRRALPTAPLHAFTSPGPGSGKSYLVDWISTIATGFAAAVITQSRSDEETDKRIAAALIAGDALISLDNCEHALGGGALCVAISQPTSKNRMLGLSLNIETPNNAAFFATANNLLLGADMPRRSLVGTMDPQQERPELRQFEDDPVKIARRERGRYIAATLTILRAFHNAGRPEIAPPIGSFAEWSLLVRNALLWLGEADPCETMEKAREADEQLKQLVAVMDAWEAVPTLSDRRKSVNELIAVASEEDLNPAGGILYRHAGFREALLAVAGGDGGNINARRLGKWLAKNERRVCRGRRIVRDGGRAGFVFWKLELVEAP